VVAWFCLAATRGQKFTIFGDGKQIRDTLWVDDLVDAYETALDRIDEVKGQVFNLGGGPSNTLSLLNWSRPSSGTSAGRWTRDSPTGGRATSRLRRRHPQAARLLDWSPKVATADGVARLLAWIGENRASSRSEDIGGLRTED